MAYSQVKTAYYYVKDGESLSLILTERLGLDPKHPDYQKTVKHIKHRNVHVTNWDKLEVGEELYLEIPESLKLEKKRMKLDPVVAKKKKKHQKKQDFETAAMEEAEDKKKGIVASDKDEKTQYSMNAFYTISMGSFSETVSNGNKVESSQNSPLSLGGMMLIKPKGYFFYSTSLYFSYLQGAGVEGGASAGQQITIPLEIGFNAYASGPTPLYKFSWYGGFDFEKFSTYNTSELSNSVPLEVRSNKMGFATVGISKVWNVLNRNFLFKLGLSQSIFSSSSATPADGGEASFSGQRFILYLNTFIYDQMVGHFIFKQHRMSGPSDIVITRFGVGVGWRVF